MNTAAVPASKLLNAYLKQAIAPVLLDAGFKATGRVFRRVADEALHIVDIQNWKFNDARRARFTIEVGVCFPRLLNAVAEIDAYAFYRPNLAKPGITECAVRRRLGMFLEPAQDTWWTVSATTGYAPPAEEVTSPLVNRAFPWLQHASQLSALLAVGAQPQVLSTPVMAVAACFALGDADAGRQAAAALARSRHPNQAELERSLLDALLGLHRLHSGQTSAV